MFVLLVALVRTLLLVDCCIRSTRLPVVLTSRLFFQAGHQAQAGFLVGPVHVGAISLPLYLIKKELLAVHLHVTSSNLRSVPEKGHPYTKLVVRRMTKAAHRATGFP